MIHIHKWGRWSKAMQTEVFITSLQTGNQTRVAAQYQSRECETCGKVKVRRIKRLA